MSRSITVGVPGTLAVPEEVRGEWSRGGIVFMCEECAVDTLRCRWEGDVREEGFTPSDIRAALVRREAAPLWCIDVVYARPVKQIFPERSCLQTRTHPFFRREKVLLVTPLRLEKSAAVRHGWKGRVEGESIMFRIASSPQLLFT